MIIPFQSFKHISELDCFKYTVFMYVDAYAVAYVVTSTKAVTYRPGYLCWRLCFFKAQHWCILMQPHLATRTKGFFSLITSV